MVLFKPNLPDTISIPFNFKGPCSSHWYENARAKFAPPEPIYIENLHQAVRPWHHSRSSRSDCLDHWGGFPLERY